MNDLKAGLVALLLAVSTAVPAATLTPKEAAELLNVSVGMMQDGGSQLCTASKIGPYSWLTAGHCASRLSNKFRIDMPSTYVNINSATVGLAEKDSNRDADWAILNASDATPTIPSLELGCGEAIYRGMSIAYLGFPAEARRSFSIGYVSTLDPIANNGRNGADFAVDLQAAPGASGAPIISMESGKVIGILTEGVMGGGGFFLIGVESVNNLPMCATQVIGKGTQIVVDTPDIGTVPVIPSIQTNPDQGFIDWT